MYPTIEQYKDAIRIAEHSLATLQDYEPVLKADGEPWFSSGNFAVVFQMKHFLAGKRLALKCFTRHQERRQESYRLISEALAAHPSNYLLAYQYLDQEIWVSDHNGDGAEYPLVAMEWAEGMTLGDYVKLHCSERNKDILQTLAHNFEVFCAWLIAQPFAHGDLKPDNIIVRENGSLALVDYDGMFVPTMQGQQAREFGSPIYRHPKRTLDTYDAHIDDFSLLVLLSELRLVAADPTLYNSSLSGESIVAKAGDWQNPNDARILQAMQVQATNGGDLAWITWAAMLRITAQSSGHEVADWGMVVDKGKKIKITYDLPDFIPYRKGGKWGFCDRNKKIVIECVYDKVNLFYEGFAEVKKDNKYYFIDKIGKEVIPFDDVHDQTHVRFSKGLERVEKDGKYGFIDDTRKEVIPCIYDSANSFSEGLAGVKKDEKWGFIDKTGNVLIPCIYDEANSFSEGLAGVKKDEKWGFIDKIGNVLIPCIYDEANRFSEGLARVEKDGKYGFIDKTGKEAILFIYDDAWWYFSEGLAGVKKDEKWGFIDKTGNVLIPCIYDEANRFSKGLAKVKKDKKWGFIDERGVEYWED